MPKLIRQASDVPEHVSGLDVVAAGHAILAARGILDPTADQLAEAYAAAGAGGAAPTGPETGRVASNNRVAAAAMRILSRKLIFQPTEQELLNAIEEAASETNEHGYRVKGSPVSLW